MKNIKHLKKDKFNFIQKVLFTFFQKYFDDRRFAIWSLKRWIGDSCIDNPKTFNEKLQWLKLNKREDFYKSFVDKLVVKSKVEQILGRQYITETLKIWDKVDDIKLEDIPKPCILKTNHGSGSNIIIKESTNIDLKILKKNLNSMINKDYYKLGREWVYKDIEPKIFCEELLIDNEGKIPKDFKIFCFNGTAKYIQIDLDRFSNHQRVFYDTNWIKQEFNILYPLSSQSVNRPDTLEEMLGLAEKMSKGLYFARVDFYSLPEVKFGELTFFPGNATEPFTSKEWDLKLGNLIDLNN